MPHKEQIIKHEWGRNNETGRPECQICKCTVYTDEVDDYGNSVDSYKQGGKWFAEEPPCITRPEQEKEKAPD